MTLRPVKKINLLRDELHTYYIQASKMGHVLQFSLREALSDIACIQEDSESISYLKNEKVFSI